VKKYIKVNQNATLPSCQIFRLQKVWQGKAAAILICRYFEEALMFEHCTLNKTASQLGITNRESRVQRAPKFFPRSACPKSVAICSYPAFELFDVLAGW
jgi:hypothetical protein